MGFDFMISVLKVVYEVFLRALFYGDLYFNSYRSIFPLWNKIK